MATAFVKEDLPPSLVSTSEPPPLFDGTTRLYIAYICPFAQRAWIARNYKGLQDKIKLVPIDLGNRPTWYKEKVYPENKVPSLEYNNKVIGESLDLLKFIDSNFEGPTLLPNDPAKQQFAEELISYSDTFNKTVYTSFKGDPVKEVGSVFDYLETALHKYDDGPFFLGQFSLVDIAYVPFVERFQLVLQDAWQYDITAGRPKLAAWIEEIDKINAYTQTKYDPKVIVEQYKKRFLVPSLEYNKKVIGESLDLLKYLEDNFEGPKLLPNDPAKQEFAEELLSYVDTFTGTVYAAFKGDPPKEAGFVFDHLETALHRFDDGPFILGQFSLVDIAYAPFTERFQLVLQDVWKYDITAGRPKLAAWMEEMEKIDAYTQTKYDPKELVNLYKKRFLAYK